MASEGLEGTGDGGGNEPFTGRAAIAYDHGYDAEVFYLGLALDERYVGGFVEGCLERSHLAPHRKDGHGRVEYPRDALGDITPFLLVSPKVITRFLPTTDLTSGVGISMAYLHQ